MTTMAVALAMGLHATHMLVPPTPGPLAVAGIFRFQFRASLFLCGMLVSIPVTIVAILQEEFLEKNITFLPEIEEAHVDEKIKNYRVLS